MLHAGRARNGAALGVVLAGACLARAGEAQTEDLLIRPMAPPLSIADLAAPAGFGPSPGVPVVKFADDAVITEWLFACPASFGADLASALVPAAAGDGPAPSFLAKLKKRGGARAPAASAAGLVKRLKPLPQERIVPDSYPDFTPAIDLLALSDGRDRAQSVYHAVVDNDQPRLVRACVGAEGEGVSATLWVAGRRVEHGQLLRLTKGPYPIVIQAYSGQVRYRWQWRDRRLAPRFTEVSEPDVQAVNQWQADQWRRTVDCAKTDAAKLLSAVKFDPPTLRGTEGFFRVGRSVNGRWWFIDPQGRAFYHMGICALNCGGMGGRRIGRPPVPEPTVRKWLEILTGRHFSAMGSWTTPEFFDKGVAFAEIIEGFYVGPYIRGGRYGGGIMPDVFDPQWEANLDAKCRKLCTPLRNSKLLLGYYLDNERGFRETRGHGVRIIPKAPVYVLAGAEKLAAYRSPAEPVHNSEALGLLQYCLSFPNAKPAAYKKAWEFALARYGGSLAGVGKAWGVPIAAEPSIMELTSRGQRLISEAYLDDEDAFVQLFVEQYYRVFTRCIRKYDPNHLMLGMRHGGTPGPAALKAEGKWADVVSRNNYMAEFAQRMDAVHQETGRPVLNGEYPDGGDTFQWVRNPIEPPGGYGRWQRNDLRQRASIDGFFAHPGLIGYTYYKWYGRPPSLGTMQWLCEANRRAVPIAVQWDRPPRTSHDPLEGQVFLTLLGGMASVARLPAADAEAPPSLLVRAGELHVGLICRGGVWDKRVYGNGTTGEITSSRAQDPGYRVAFKARMIPGMFTFNHGEGQYVLDLVRNDTKLEGTFEGTSNGQKVAGRVLGCLYRPVPTPNL